MADQFDLSMNGMMHRAFLRDFDRIADAVRTDRWESARRRWTLVGGLLHEHHQHEDEHLWPPMLAKITDPADRAVVEAMEAEHAELADALAACEADFAGARPAASSDRQAVVDHLAVLSEVLRRHTAHEEAEGEPLVQRFVTPEEFKVFLSSARSGPSRMIVMPWIADGAEPADVDKVWGYLPRFVRLFLKPRMERTYLARLAA